MIASLLAFVVLITLLPFFAGLLPVRGMQKNHQNLVMIYIAGWFMMFALFQIVSIPFIILQYSFDKLVVVYSILLFVYTVISMIVGRKTLVWSLSHIKNKEQKLSFFSVLLWVVVIGLIIAQMVFLLFYQHLDGDDAYFIALSNDCLTLNSMYQVDAYTGELLGGLEIRHALSPLPVWIAWLAKVTKLHPTIVAHSFIAPLFLGIMYLIYILIGRRLLSKSRVYVPLFVLFLMCWYLFGNISIYSKETFMYLRTWQGKAMFGNLIIPLIYLCFLYLMEEKAGWGEWIFFETVLITAVLTTSVAVFMVPILVFFAMVFMYVRNRQWKQILGMCLSMLPYGVFGLLYLYVK